MELLRQGASTILKHDLINLEVASQSYTTQRCADNQLKVGCRSNAAFTLHVPMER